MRELQQGGARWAVRGSGWALTVAVSVAVSVVLSGCISVGIGSDAGVQPMYELQDGGAGTNPNGNANASPAATAVVPTLLIQALPGSAVAETTSIAYARQPNEVAYYRLASWAERPVRRIPRLLQQRLEARNVATAVGLLGDPLTSDWLLTVSVERLVHDVATPPGSAQLRLGAALYDRRSGQRIGSASFDASAPVVSADSAAAVAAMSVALGRGFDALAPWVDSRLQEGLARRAAPAAAAARTSSAPIIAPIVSLR